MDQTQAVRGIHFVKVSDYTSFDAEYALVGVDIVIHLFQPHDGAHGRNFWCNTLPEILDRHAREFWEETYPRLQAAYTPELDSWWFRAFGFAYQGLPHERVHKFLEGLDTKIDDVLRKPSC